jgi:hypothetical protein
MFFKKLKIEAKEYIKSLENENNKVKSFNDKFKNIIEDILKSNKDDKKDSTSR